MLTYYEVFSWDGQWVGIFETEDTAEEVASLCCGRYVKVEEEPPIL